MISLIKRVGTTEYGETCEIGCALSAVEGGTPIATCQADKTWAIDLVCTSSGMPSLDVVVYL